MQGEHSNSLCAHAYFPVLQWGMSAWRRNAETKRCGVDLAENMLSLLDLRFAGVSPHLVCILQNLNFQQCGKIVGSMEDSVEFDIAAGWLDSAFAHTSVWNEANVEPLMAQVVAQPNHRR